MTNTRPNLSAAQVEIISALQESPCYKKDQAFKKFFSQMVAYEDAFETTYFDTEKEREEKIEIREKLEKDKKFMSIYTGKAIASYTAPLALFDIEITECDKKNDPTLFQVTFHKAPKEIKFTFSPNSTTSFFRFRITAKGNLMLADNTLKQFDECSEKYPAFVEFLSALEHSQENLAAPDHSRLKRSLTF